MSQIPRKDPAAQLHPEEARARLEAAEGADDAARLEALEELHSALQEELDAGEAPQTGR
jgi:hypothetical protein